MHLTARAQKQPIPHLGFFDRARLVFFPFEIQLPKWLFFGGAAAQTAS
jgi:hypothetical protein